MRQHVSVQMVDIHDRHPQTERKPLGKRCAHMQRPKQSRPARKSDGRKLMFVDTRTFESRIDHRHDILLMSARSQFRHHATILRMHILRRDDIAQQHTVAYHSRRRIIARRLYSQYYNAHSDKQFPAKLLLFLQNPPRPTQKCERASAKSPICPTLHKKAAARDRAATTYER